MSSFMSQISLRAGDRLLLPKTLQFLGRSARFCSYNSNTIALWYHFMSRDHPNTLSYDRSTVATSSIVLACISLVMAVEASDEGKEGGVRG
jgi:hypothetical protein